MKRLFWLLIVCVGLLWVVSSCTMMNTGVGRQQTQLQTRQFQTREYDSVETKRLMKAILNVLQDDGFVVKNAVVDLGLLSAIKETDLQRQNQPAQGDTDIFGILLDIFSSGKRSGKSAMRTSRFQVVEATVNISEFGSQSRVRVSFQAKILDERGEPLEVYPIDDMKFYQEFFAKVDKGIFLQKQKL